MAEPVRAVEGKAVPLDADDVDTDAIIPAQYLKIAEKAGLGRYLFYSHRYDATGRLTGNFVLDRPEYRDARILIAGRNFGIGSSRENAVWALMDFGLECIIAASFGDIFYSNASKNGLLCVRLAEDTVDDLRTQTTGGALLMSVDLAQQRIRFAGTEMSFEIESYLRERLLRGEDEIAYTLRSYGALVNEHEAAVPKWLRPRS